MNRSRLRLLIVTASIAVVAALAIGWAWLPGTILDRYLRISAAMGEDYRGRAEAVELHWLGYSLRDVVVERRDRAIETPLVRVREVRVQLDPFARRAAVELEGLRLHLVAPGNGAMQLGERVPWRHFLDQLAPGFAMHRIRGADAELELRLAGLADAPLRVDRFTFALDALDAVPSDEQPAPARIDAHARLLDHASLDLDAVFDPEGTMRRLNADLRLDDLDLPRFDAYARFWHGVDFESGRGTARLRFTTQDGHARGRFVATLTQVDVFDAGEDLGRDGDGLLAAARDLLAGGAAVARDGRLQVEQPLDARIELPDDNLEGLQAVLALALASVQPGG